MFNGHATAAKAGTHNRSASYDAAYKSQYPDIRRLQDWQVLRKAHLDKTLAYVIEVPSAEEGANLSKGQPSFVPATSPDGGAAVGGVWPQLLPKSVSLAGESSSQASDSDSDDGVWV